MFSGYSYLEEVNLLIALAWSARKQLGCRKVVDVGLWSYLCCQVDCRFNSIKLKMALLKSLFLAVVLVFLPAVVSVTGKNFIATMLT